MTRTEALRKLYKKVTNEEAPVGANTTTEALQKVYEALTNDTTHHINVTEIIDDLATNWDSGGGGGSSDFSTAQVTVVNNMGGLISANNMIRISDGYMAAAGMIRTGTANITAVLYKNMARWIVSTGTVTATGNATIETAPSGTAVIITGDCTITINSEGGSDGGGGGAM